MPNDEMRERARKQFEEWATESYGGHMGDLLSRDSHFPDTYKYADVESAWKAWRFSAREELRSAAREIREFPANQDDNILVTWRQLADWLERRAEGGL